MLLAFLNELVLIEANVELVTELFAAETFFFLLERMLFFFLKCLYLPQNFILFSLIDRFIF